MYHGFLQRRNRFWIQSVLFSVIHLLVCASIISLIWVELTLWFSEEMVEFLGELATFTIYILNIPAYLAVLYGHAYVTPGTPLLILLSVLVVIDSALYGASLATMVWLATHNMEARSRYLGFSPRVVGRGLFFALGYCAISVILGIELLADSHGLLASYFVWGDEINAVVQFMHPLPTLLELEPGFDLESGFRERTGAGVQYIVAVILDSAVIGMLVVWGWTWLLPTLGLPHKASLRR